VTQIALESGGVRAQVQGSRAKPYDVTIRMKPLEPSEWRAVATAIASDVRLSAALLAGDMPADIETAFRAANVSLFPASTNDMKTACSCPDWSNPCKHIAAVFYLIGEEFDRDPFLLFVVRGLARDAVRDLFTATQESNSPGASKPPAPTSPAAFWGDNVARIPASTAHLIAAASDDPAVLKRAGKFPFWRGDISVAEALVPIYTDAAAFALEWLADRADTDREAVATERQQLTAETS
jgi:uncharacterized Zn finger protein